VKVKLTSKLSRSLDESVTFIRRLSTSGSSLGLTQPRYITRMLIKTGEFFQLISTLFCVVKRGFVEPCENVPM
jgi:hypothetical protein